MCHENETHNVKRTLNTSKGNVRSVVVIDMVYVTQSIDSILHFLIQMLNYIFSINIPFTVLQQNPANCCSQ